MQNYVTTSLYYHNTTSPYYDITVSSDHQISIMARCARYIRWFSLGSPISSTNKTDRHEIAEILLKVALNTINQTQISIGVV